MELNRELEMQMVSRHTPGVHAKAKQSRVAIAGCGGLGSNIAVMLARTGVGELLLVDFDTVEPSNLNRQHYNVTHIGMRKTAALKAQLVQINPFITVHTLDERVTAENAVEIFSGYSIVCEAFDCPISKANITNALLSAGGVTLVGASGMAGHGDANAIKTTEKFANFYLCGDYETGAQPGVVGLMAPRVMVCAAHQATKILELIVGG